VHCLPGELVERIDQLAARSKKPGSHILAELIAELDLQREDRDEKDRQQEASRERQNKRTNSPAWRRTGR
jgi:predicted transcriptional regulator